MLILRYSDFEASTLQAHMALMPRGPVYWGWWKKKHENFPREVLEHVAAEATSNTGVRIGLVARAEEQYAVAKCIDVKFLPGGESFPSPDADSTPAYYRYQPCAAWFQFTSIEVTSLEAWKAEFGPVPDGDLTLFESSPAQPIEVYPAPVVRADAKIGHTGVLHISDLHFGSDHAYGGYTGPANTPESLATKIAKSLPSRPACIVVSGDLTTRGEHDGLMSARKFLGDLTQMLDLDRNAVVLVPGNHDILVDDPEVKRDYSNEQNFRDLLQIFYGQPTELERVHDIRAVDGHHYVVGTLNSSRPRSKQTMEYGYVGVDRSTPVFRTARICAKEAEPAAVWTAVALHHHVLPGPHVEEPEKGRPVSMTLDAGEIVSLAQTHRTDALLHGHQHIPFVGKVARVAEFTPNGATDRTPIRSIAVLGAGSAGVQLPRIPQPVAANTYSVYNPFATRGMLVECFGYLEQRNVFKLWSVTL
jgi:3',5'-cyclic AMP phosphodiesterase CpdA